MSSSQLIVARVTAAAADHLTLRDDAFASAKAYAVNASASAAVTRRGYAAD